MKSVVPTIVIGVFVAGKLVSPLFATWSWWWLLMPIVPDIGVVLQKFGV